jgi:hypothetical protein
VGGHGADPQITSIAGDTDESIYFGQIDKSRRPGKALAKRWQQRLAAGDEYGAVIRLQEPPCFVE